jgi:gamma-aminobutyric acid receptor subunit beta
MKLYFVRNLGHYVIQIYLPSSLVVILSWVSFWLDRTSAPARVSLGITTVLTMLTLIWSTNASLPKISYIKSIDVYLVFCFFMTFMSVIEFGVVSFVHRSIEKKKFKLKRFKEEEKEKEEKKVKINKKEELIENDLFAEIDFIDSNENDNVLKENYKKIETSNNHIIVNCNKKESPPINSVKFFGILKASTIDKYSRFLFPSVFLIFHLIYWTIYFFIVDN